MLCLLYRLYRGFGRQGHCIGVIVPADKPVGNVNVIVEVFFRGGFLQVVGDVDFQFGPGLELFLPVVVGVHVGEDVVVYARNRVVYLDSSEIIPYLCL